MPRPLDVDYLQPGEEPLLVAGRHRLSAFDGLLSILFSAAIGVAFWYFGTRFAPDEVAPFLAGFLVFIAAATVIGIIALWWRVETSRYVITPERVYRSHGRIRFRLMQTTYDKVTDLHVRQSLFGRWWDFGDITLHTAGVGLQMEGVRDPYALKQRVEQARTKFLATLIEEHRVAARPLPLDEARQAPEGHEMPSPVPRGQAHAIWNGGPVLVSVLPGIISALGMGVFAFIVAGIAVASETRMMLLIALALALSAFATLAGAVIQYKYTRYEVADWGVVVTSGWLTRKRVETTYSKVTDVTTYQGLAGRLFDFGNITINTAGSNQAAVVFQGLSRPESVKAMIDEARGATDGRRRRSG